MTQCFDQSRKMRMPMEPNRTTRSCRRAGFAVAQLFAFSCLLTCGCGHQASSIQQIPSADHDPQKEMIEHVIGAKLPESASNCRYHSKSYGMGRGTGWGFFEISRADLPALLDASDNLPDASDFRQDSRVRSDIEKYPERTGESIAWWKPLTLQKRQYANKIIGSENVTERFALIMLPAINICIGEIRDDWMGVYLVYHCD